MNQKLEDILLAGAIGDAFGYQVEFDTIKTIKQEHGSTGLQKFTRLPALASDDTQMSIFAMDAINYAIEKNLATKKEVLENITLSFCDWYITQTANFKKDGQGCATPLARENSILWNRRAPGNTCLSALNHVDHYIDHYNPMDALDLKINESWGCGAVMRAAPVIGLKDLNYSLSDICDVAVMQGAITHGHPKGYLPSAALVNFLLLSDKKPFNELINSSITILKGYDHHEDCVQGLEKLRTALNDEKVLKEDELIEAFGDGFDGLSAVLIGIYCSYKAQDFKEAITLSSNHSGDSDSTAILAGELYCARKYQDTLSNDFFINHKDEIDLSGVIKNLNQPKSILKSSV